jgi:hypothetical protein
MFHARLRAEMHGLVKALAWQNYEEAAISVRNGAEWDARQFRDALAPFLEEYGRLVFNHQARATSLTRITPDGDRQWRVTQVLCDPEGDHDWFVEATVDLRGDELPDGPLIEAQRLSR